MNLRIKDIDFNRHRLIVRSGKGDKDRETLMPAKIKEDLTNHIREAWELYNKDQMLENGYDIRTVQELFGHSSVKTTSDSKP